MDAKKVHVGRPGQVLLSVVGGVQRGRRRRQGRISWMGEGEGCCIADANEGTWDRSGGKEGDGTERGEDGDTSGRGVKDNRKNLLVIKLQTDQIYIILYMYK